MVFLECSAKTKKNIEQVFDELVLKVNQFRQFLFKEKLNWFFVGVSFWNDRDYGRKAMRAVPRRPALRWAAVRVTALSLAAVVNDNNDDSHEKQY